MATYETIRAHGSSLAPAAMCAAVRKLDDGKDEVFGLIERVENLVAAGRTRRRGRNTPLDYNEVTPNLPTGFLVRR